jgi:hypothetical protein
MQIHMQLATLKKHDLSTMDYFNRVKTLTNTLATTSAPLHDDEIIVYLLSRLPEEFDSSMTLVTTRAEPMPLSEVYTNMLSFESKLINRHGTKHSLPGGTTTNYASRGDRGGGCTPGRGGGQNGGRIGGSGGNNGTSDTDRHCC